MARASFTRILHAPTYLFINFSLLIPLRPGCFYMMSIKCEECKKEIADYKSMSQIMDEDGFTHAFCTGCGEEIRKKIEERDKAIK